MSVCSKSTTKNNHCKIKLRNPSYCINSATLEQTYLTFDVKMFPDNMGKQIEIHRTVYHLITTAPYFPSQYIML